MGKAMLSKSLIQFSVDGWSCVPSLLFDLRPNYGGGNEDNGNLLQKVHAMPHSGLPALQRATTDPHLQQRLLETHRQVRVSLCGATAPFFWVLVHKVLFVPSKSLSPVLCKFWWLYGGVNSYLLQESLCHTQVSCTQSPRPCGSPLLTRTSTGDAQTQFCLSLCGVSGPSHVH